jgi:uncharacterized protein YdeI (YjbR/CyaY-like superfamily)
MAQTDAPILAFETPEQFEAWLEEHHADEGGVWLKVAKASSGIKSITIPEALDVALCFGWIDGKRKGLDDKYYLQSYSQRRARSTWSQINRDKVAALAAAGRIRPAGLAEVERAKADGRWDRAYGSPRAMPVPPEMQKFLDEDAQAATFFKGLNSANRFAYLYRLHHAKREQTRAKLLRQLHEGHLFH